jgi:hypothetical protein
VADKPLFWTEVTSGLRGYFAVLMSNRDGFEEPEQSGIGSYKTRDGAEREAKDWAESEGISYGRPLDKPIDYSQF